MARSKMKESQKDKKKISLTSSRKVIKKKKSLKLKVPTVLEGSNFSLLEPPVNLMSAQNNIRHSIFNCRVTNIMKTQTDASSVNILKPNSAEKLIVTSPVFVQEAVEEDLSVMYTNFMRSVKFFVAGKNMVLAICEHPIVIPFYGVLGVSILHGKAEVLGFTFSDRTPLLNVFSLKDSGLLQITISRNCQSILDLRELREKIEERCPCMTAPEIDSVITNMKPNSVLVLLVKSTEKKMETFLNTHCKSSLFPTKSSIREKLLEVSHSEELKKIERLLSCQFLHPSEPEKFFSVGDQWQQLVDQTLNSATSDSGNVTLLAGGKGVGKSTLLRYLINQCLSQASCKKVLLIDLDPGQCELTLPGCLSVHVVSKPLLGPNFSHLSHKGRLWFLGDVNVTQCFDGYLHHLEQILYYCSSHVEFRNMPWFINSMGFCKGLGVELMSCTISYFRPTHVIQIQSKRESNNYPDFLSPDIVKKYKRFIRPSICRVPGDLSHHLSVVASASNVNPNAKNPPERRGAVILSYFSEILPKSASALTDVTPFVTDVTNLEIIICHIKNLNRAQSLAAINGNLVALCIKDTNNILDHECLGFGIVRGIDLVDGRLFLLTPLEQELKFVNCLMMGNVFLPVSVNLQSHSSGHVPYVNIGEGQITSRITRRSFKPAPMLSFQERFGNKSRVEQF